MVQVPIISGVFTDNGPDVRQSFPVNMVAVGLQNGVSKGYLRPAPGAVTVSTGAGTTRGQIQWRGVLYAVQGTSFVSIAADGTQVIRGTVAAGGNVRMVYGFNHLAVASGGNLYFWDLSTFAQVTDPNIGVVVDVTWQGGYFAVTDGTIWRVSDLNDPFTWPVLAFDEPASQPDPTVAILRVRNEVCLVGASTIEVYSNVGTQPFPFGVNLGAQIQKGAVGTFACCVFKEAIAFVGGGENEQPAVYLGANGQTVKLSTRAIDQILQSYSTVQMADTLVEFRTDSGDELLYVHLPDRTLLYNATASEALGVQVWSVLTDGLVGFSQYRLRFFVWCYDQWNIADPTSEDFGYLTIDSGTVFGSLVRCEFATPMIYNDGRGGIIHQLELVCLPGRVPTDYTPLNEEPTIATSYSLDGETWSADQWIGAGVQGDRRKRLVWRRQGRWANLRMQRFRFTTACHIAVLRLEAQVEGLTH